MWAWMRQAILFRIGFDAVRDRVSDVLLGDHAGNVASTWDPGPTHHYRHDGMPAPHATDNIKGGLVLAHHGEVAARDIAQPYPGAGALPPSAQTCIDADHAVDVTFVGNHHVAQAPGVLGLTQIVIETRIHR